ncbi:hypothetical protein A1O3_03327 [Capronia epimyces CBS 606.96]|uniref:Asl1-like glycosyl hydrolase catalytic domain-containing protein n=1 Tax=Capronia epimyces CBS 606.96 TaxID=1182542 RepID=W9YAX2_9EURO|nr:uncharacterized protein A1O3_03327 [Capronia epimyces CBS 606.96]EXJ86376.1 hypothetical protein A1O3_03327 [Capronia epimyces CBS 606.96]
MPSQSKLRPAPPPKPKSLSSTPVTSVAPASGKRGLCWPWDQPGSHFKLFEPYTSSTGKIKWIFNWELWVPDSLPQEVEWIPCVRTAEQAKDIDPFLTDILQRRERPPRTSALLGFNEPEIPEQANLSVEAAVALWTHVVLPAKTKFRLRLGSPGMSSDLGRSKPWLDSFLARLGAHHGIDFLVLHWYGPRFQDLRVFLEHMHQAYGLPIWLNEFACSKMGQGEASADEVSDFLREALPWLDTCPWIERYAYFGHQDVGAWVGHASNFSEPVERPAESDTKRLTQVARLYCEH